MSCETNVSNILSDVNSTTLLLSSNGEFIGIGEDVMLYNTVIVVIASDVESSKMGVHLEFSQDNINWDIKKCFTFTQVQNEFKQDILGRFFRIRYKNGATNQTYFRLQTKFSTIEVVKKKKKWH